MQLGLLRRSVDADLVCSSTSSGHFIIHLGSSLLTTFGVLPQGLSFERTWDHHGNGSAALGRTSVPTKVFY